jgi:hypothetical protein
VYRLIPKNSENRYSGGEGVPDSGLIEFDDEISIYFK